MTIYDFVKKYNISKAIFITYFTFFALIIYFIFFTLFGSKGLVQYFYLKKEIYQQNLEKKALLNEIKQKQNDVQSMKPESLDLDLLEEEARKNLGYSKKNEIIIFQEQQKNDKNDK